MSRAYVITHGWAGQEGVQELVSNRKLAIKACEDLLESKQPGHEQSWPVQDKHYGRCNVMEADEYCTYEMFYVNQGPNR